jgi:hypothetical protein
MEEAHSQERRELSRWSSKIFFCNHVHTGRKNPASTTHPWTTTFHPEAVALNSTVGKFILHTQPTTPKQAGKLTGTPFVLLFFLGLIAQAKASWKFGKQTPKGNTNL